MRLFWVPDTRWQRDHTHIQLCNLYWKIKTLTSVTKGQVTMSKWRFWWISGRQTVDDMYLTHKVQHNCHWAECIHATKYLRVRSLFPLWCTSKTLSSRSRSSKTLSSNTHNRVTCSVKTRVLFKLPLLCEKYHKYSDKKVPILLFSVILWIKYLKIICFIHTSEALSRKTPNLELI